MDKLFLVEEIYYIEDYYSASVFNGIFTTIEKANSFVAIEMERALRKSWIIYLKAQFQRELTVIHQEELDRQRAIRLAISDRQPKYKNKQQDKEALAAHHALKRAWNEELASAHEANADFIQENIYGPAKVKALAMKDDLIPSELLENIYGPAKVKALAMKDDLIPSELLEKVKDYCGRAPEFKITEIVVDKVSEHDCNIEDDEN